MTIADIYLKLTVYHTWRREGVKDASQIRAAPLTWVPSLLFRRGRAGRGGMIRSVWVGDCEVSLGRRRGEAENVGI